MTDERTKQLEDIGRNAYKSIAEMVAALTLDWDRLEELQEERDDWEPDDNDGQQWDEANEDDAAELAELLMAKGDCEDRDDAEQVIRDDPLSLEVRSGWTSPGADMEPEEFCLLLTTGGPAVRIVGEIDGGEACSARLEVQDWFTPWTVYRGADEDVLLEYARCFYFGE